MSIAKLIISPLLALSICLVSGAPVAEDIIKNGELTYLSTSVKKVDNLSHLKKLLSSNFSISKNDGSLEKEDVAQAPTTDGKSSDSALSENGDYSDTNNQVEGVSEADSFKTDGKYLYYLIGRQLAVLSNTDNNGVKVVSTVSIPSNDESFSELYISGNKIVVVANKYEYIKPEATTSENKIAADDAYILPYYNNKNYTVFYVYDTTNKEKLILDRRVEIEGYAVSTRMIDSVLYFVTSKWLYLYNGVEGLKESDILPSYSDSAVSGNRLYVDAKNISYFPGSHDNQYMMVGAFDVNTNDAVTPQAFLGAGNTIYVNKNSLYVARQSYEENSTKTVFYRFAIDKNKVNFVASSKVDGYLINQYAMDEYNGYFRAALTVDGQNGSSLYTFDIAQMKQSGELNSLAKGEQIYSVKFSDDIAYVVTFKQVDPLFVIDLKNPEHPTLLSELKVPGFSTYLHSLNSDTLVGFGRNVADMYIKDENGKEIVVGTRDMGMKISVFDVSDKANPKELFAKPVGGSGTWSEALYNPKTIMIDKKKGFFGFQIDYNNYDFVTGQSKGYYNGAMIVSINEKSGVKVVAELKPDAPYFEGTTRLIYIGNKLYLAIRGSVYEFDYSTFKETSKLVDIFNSKSLNEGNVDIAVPYAKGAAIVD